MHASMEESSGSCFGLVNLDADFGSVNACQQYLLVQYGRCMSSSLNLEIRNADIDDDKGMEGSDDDDAGGEYEMHIRQVQHYLCLPYSYASCYACRGGDRWLWCHDVIHDHSIASQGSDWITDRRNSLEYEGCFI